MKSTQQAHKNQFTLIHPASVMYVVRHASL
jgi:hypothetical protein